MPRPPQPNSPARLPASPRHASQSDTKTKEELAAVRNQANLKTVQRNDPALAEILDTTAYAVIYHWGDSGKWEKQKQEGSLFVIRRTKAPEYALFMLNRQAVKNVTIPLVPGEMKATVIDASMLQVARRGEKIRYGIWFTDSNDVQRFRDTIVRVCGEPVKPPPGSAPSSSSAPAPSSSGPRSAAPAATAVAPFHPPNHSVAPYKPQQEDGLSRLFAGLTTVPAGSSGGPSPQPASPMPTDPAIYNHTPTHQTPSHQTPTRTSPQQQPPQQQQARSSPPPAQNANFAPGQTVDDLLRGILGQPSGQPSPQPPAPRQPPSAPAQPQFTSPPPPPGPGGFPPGPPMNGAGPAGPGPTGPNGPPNGFFGPGGIPPPVVARDALADTLPPPPSGPNSRDQMKDMINALMREDRFVDDVWRAYCARTGRPM